MPTSRKSRRSRKTKTILPKPVSGSLGDYSTKKSATSRRRSLSRRVSRKGYATTVRELNLRATLNKRNKKVYSTMKSDMEYLHDKYRSNE